MTIKKTRNKLELFLRGSFLNRCCLDRINPLSCGLVIPCYEYNVDPYQPASQKVTDQNQLFTTLPLNQPKNLILCNTYGGKLGISVTF